MAIATHTSSGGVKCGQCWHENEANALACRYCSNNWTEDQIEGIKPSQLGSTSTNNGNSAPDPRPSGSGPAIFGGLIFFTLSVALTVVKVGELNIATIIMYFLAVGAALAIWLWPAKGPQQAETSSSAEEQAEVSRCMQVLSQIGYRVTAISSGWEIHEPLGGRHKLDTVRDLTQYANERQLQKRPAKVSSADRSE